MCRDLDGGRRFRESLSRVFSLPGDAVDFVCPYARDWGWAPEPGDRIATQLPISRGEDIYAACDECDHQVWPSGGARGCELIGGGKPCALGARLRVGGPWPDVCPRNEDRSTNGETKDDAGEAA